MNYNTVTKNIRKKLKEYIEENDIKALVIGVSGGIDSAVCCALAKPVCDELGIPLIGRSIPIESNKQDEINRADMVGGSFCTNYYSFNLNEEYKFILKDMIVDKNDIDTKIRKGNVKARLRMIYLYDIAQENRGMVLSTDNYTEYLLGFWTLHGDVGDYGMIQNLWKTEVYELAEDLWYTSPTLNQQHALHACIKAVPTDGLGITDSDLDQLGAKDYGEADRILKIALTNDMDSFIWDDHLKYDGRPEDYNEFARERSMLINIDKNPVILRMKNSAYKRNNPFNLSRSVLFGEE